MRLEQTAHLDSRYHRNHRSDVLLFAFLPHIRYLRLGSCSILISGACHW